MRPLFALVLLLQAFHIGLTNAAEQHLELVVTEPYLEMHSGPGRGFPVVYTVGRDEFVTVLYSRTDWYKVRAPGGQEGWVRRADLARTLLASGEPAPIPPYPDFSTHRWEMGAGYGVYNRQNLVTAYGDFGITNSIDAEFVVQQASGHAGQSLCHLDWSAAYLPAGMEVVLADGRHRNRVSIHRGQGSAGTARENQPNGLCLVGCTRVHHPAIHVARRLAPLRRLQ